MHYIGIDLGGTNIAAGIVDENGCMVVKDSVPTQKERPTEEIVDDMAALCNTLCKKSGIPMEEIRSVGVGCPGAIDDKNGIVSYCNNIPMNNYPMCEILGKKLGKRVSLSNDANAAAYGEYIKNGSGCDSFLMITLGTGVGAGLVLNGKIFSGFNGVASEAGHMTLVHDGVQCTCGKKGCWEAYASVTALLRQTKEAAENHPESSMNENIKHRSKVSGRTAFEEARNGDETAKAVVTKYCEYVADGLTSLINIIEPERVCIGGGISKEGDYLLNPVKEWVNNHEYNRYCPKTAIETAKLFNDAGIIGAALAGR
ncbi:MAG: ROK family protein [bacterium]|nr:ROK family protein [bacterium]